MEATGRMSGGPDSVARGLGAWRSGNDDETERWVALVRVLVGLVAGTAGPWMVLSGRMPLVMPAGLVAAVLVFLLVYSLIYRWWAPWRRYGIRIAARVATVLDLTPVVLIIPNCGGLASPYWGVGAGIVLIYIMRFGYSRRGLLTSLIVFPGTAALSQWLAPLPATAVFNALIGIVLSFVVIVWAGITLVRRERRHLQRALEAEHRAISRIVNTVQHEVNNPLAVASGNMELLRNRTGGDQGAPYVERIETALGRIGEAVTRLRALEEHRVLSGEGYLARYVSADQVEAVDEEESREHIIKLGGPA